MKTDCFSFIPQESVHIYIPTYNSETTLQNLITSLKESANECKVFITITIVDNASSDSTWDIILNLNRKGIIQSNYRHPSNMGIATFYHLFSIHNKRINQHGRFIPFIMCDSEDMVHLNFFSHYNSSSQTIEADLYIPRYCLYRINGTNESHSEIGTNSFYENCVYLSPLARAMAVLALPGAIGSTSAVWATGIMSNKAFQIMRNHTKKFTRNPGIPGSAWENSLIANLLYKCSFQLTGGLYLRGCIDSKYIKFPGAYSQLATVLYEMNCGGLEMLNTFTNYKLLHEDLLEKLSSIDLYRKALRGMINEWT